MTKQFLRRSVSETMQDQCKKQVELKITKLIFPNPEVSFKLLLKHSLPPLCPKHMIEVTVTVASSDLLP